MAGKSQIQIALDKIDAEIEDLKRVRSRLADAYAAGKQPKPPRKAKAKVVVADSGL